jgi:hypothetical protein
MDIFSISRSLSEHFPIRKEMILDQLQDFPLICSGFLEHFWIGSGHGVRGKNPERRFTESQEMALVCARRTKMVAKVKGSLGFGLSHPFIAAWAIWAVTVHNTSSEIT